MSAPGLRLLYCAIDQTVPGTLGGSVHVRAVAEGLAELGHEVHVLAAAGPGGFPAGRVRWHAVSAPARRPQLRLLKTRAVNRLGRAIAPQVVVERYHNFGGEGALAARASGARLVLEVNAPVVDYPGSPKALLDRALVAQPMRRWREWQCRQADLIVTPSAAILPPDVPAARVLEIEWGADTDRFRPNATGPVPYARPAGTMTVAFAGAFRAWHGAARLVEAVRVLRTRGVEDVRAVLIGDGPERPAVAEAARGVAGVTLTGALPHDAMPAALAAADVGAAPFDPSRHPALQLAFFWSPLKVFEYMAAGLPVVAPGLPRLAALVRDGVEGVLYEPTTPGALADALVALRDPARRQALGAAARARVETLYSWRAHCAALDAAIRGLVGAS